MLHEIAIALASFVVVLAAIRTDAHKHLTGSKLYPVKLREYRIGGIIRAAARRHVENGESFTAYKSAIPPLRIGRYVVGIEQLTRDEFFSILNGEQKADAHGIGYWHDMGRDYFDKVYATGNFMEAIRLAQTYNQRAIFDRYLGDDIAVAPFVSVENATDVSSPLWP